MSDCNVKVFSLIYDKSAEQKIKSMYILLNYTLILNIPYPNISQIYKKIITKIKELLNKIFPDSANIKGNTFTLQQNLK